MSTPNPPLDREAKRRLAIIRHVEEVSGNVALTCRYYGISRQAYYIWYRRYQAEGVEGLRTRSKRPTPGTPCRDPRGCCPDRRAQVVARWIILGRHFAGSENSQQNDLRCALISRCSGGKKSRK
ncbi:leucine zipper domain-containing protein [Streptosporangium sp. NPDC002544]|uniref:helix-turn-helix domain-containing protein n=1 Tax=Streptosporangium sp. NPDC002544 TaxID=3154538 RepID=UPI003319446C